mmetsp:Transcript_58093/g.189156  ORF Transcript_58093/g.189156 Transcript_58093/m.189156 type:complete len:445 (+) Transcript_58093:71-1405(+)|eukprot:CAMPEP_0203867534 /NCGR_PEP_ID=MMETSP0359-20131031/16575_1 /ASSEMBLY_ACC=CAM_ASM_000338 /TAXON_ID=268821 /ORGANISM="Scrippsiella Hangoei, Strain SHTV-5" /LENGTH=444 /DNA_ID=CAMNT_0050785789 /DNA_START=65 /DNA_END=1399 /DNA_ORIENTATION=+
MVASSSLSARLRSSVLVGMGKKKVEGDATQDRGLGTFVGALRRQLADKQRVVRAFDIGGSGVKTGLLGASALQDFLRFDGAVMSAAGDAAGADEELQWIEPQTLLGVAPGEDGFSSWLLEALPRLRREVDDPHVCFGVSIGGDVEHATGMLRDWWPGGGHPRDFERPVLVAELMGLPPARTFVLHDGEAHLLGCSRCAVPPPGLACLAIGSGIGLGITDASGAVVDSSHPTGARSYCLSGIPLSGARYQGIWKQWLERPGGDNARVEEVKAMPFANMVNKPWRMPWVSLVLGRRGMEMAEAAFECPEPTADNDEVRLPAVRAYGEQWLHFLHTQLVPQMCTGTRRHTIERLCFAGGVAERNWPALRETMVEANSDMLLPASAVADDDASAAGSSKRGRPSQQKAKAPSARPTVMPPAPVGSALIGSAIYALAGVGGGAEGIWAR